MKCLGRLDVVAFTHRGRARLAHEDAIVVGDRCYDASMPCPERSAHSLTTPMVCAVADGMGGHAAGAVASQRVMRLLQEAAPSLQDEATLVDILRKLNDTCSRRWKRARRRAAWARR